VLGASYTLVAALAVAVAVPLGALGPVPADAFASLSWRTVASVVFFALFAGAPCLALAALSLVCSRPRELLPTNVE
jgi:hypothetical protein